MSEKRPLDYPCPTCKAAPHDACVYESFSQLGARRFEQRTDMYHHARVVIAARKNKKRATR